MASTPRSAERVEYAPPSKSGAPLRRPTSASGANTSLAAAEFYEALYGKGDARRPQSASQRPERAQRPQSATPGRQQRLEEHRVAAGPATGARGGGPGRARPQSAGWGRSPSSGAGPRPGSAGSRGGSRPGSAGSQRSAGGRQQQQQAGAGAGAGAQRRASSPGFLELRERERGWDSRCVLERALDVPTAAGSGLRALRNKRASASGGAAPSAPLRKGRRSKYRVLCDELQRLWEELRVPARDREFFLESYCQAKGQQERRALIPRLVEQRDLLLRHRTATLETLRAVQQREALLARLRRLSVEQVYGKPEEEPGGLGLVLHELRLATVRVVRCVQLWRKDLWRPLPFVWQGMNYVVKMQSDARFFGKTIDRTSQDAVLFADSALCPPEQDEQELDDVRAVVAAETHVQCELRGEHKRLIAAGYYIPMLRWSPEDAPQAVEEQRAREAPLDEQEQYQDDRHLDAAEERNEPPQDERHEDLAYAGEEVAEEEEEGDEEEEDDNPHHHHHHHQQQQRLGAGMGPKSRPRTAPKLRSLRGLPPKR
jgi:hypothetical protein